MNTYPGKLLLVIGTAGSGKGTLIKHVKDTYPDILYPHTATTRTMRPGEVDGEHYFFFTKEEFERHVEMGDFLEWAAIDGGRLYGTLKKDVFQALESGNIALKEIEIQGLRQVEALLPKENIVTIYIDAGGWDVLSRRIQGRAPISPEELESRRERYEYEKDFINEADYVVENHDGQFKQADEAFEKILLKYLHSA